MVASARFVVVGALGVLGGCSFQTSMATTGEAGTPGPEAGMHPEAGCDQCDASIPLDAKIAPGDAPKFVLAKEASTTNNTELGYQVTVTAGSNLFLLVSIGLGTTCAGTVPNITSVTYGGFPLTQLATIVGVPCGAGGTRSDQWGLIAPVAGPGQVVIILDGLATTIQSGAFELSGVNQTTPVRAFSTARGESASSTVTVASNDDDLVVDTVGQGHGIIAPGAGQTERFVDNAGTGNTLDNLAGSTASGAASTTMTWTFSGSDEWQSIAASIQK